MSLLSILSSSQALQNTETQIGVVSTNIGNSQNPNYVVRQGTTVENGTGTGVVDVTRQVNATLQQAVFSQSATSTASSTVSALYSRLEQLTGSASGTPTLANATTALVTAFQNFATTPESTSTQAAVIQAANNIVSAVQTISAGVETIATQVQTQTQTDVNTLNSDLSQIAQLNTQIQATRASGQSSADLEDQRDSVLTTISALLPIQTQANSDGTINISMPGGVSLVSGANATQFTYTGYNLGNGGGLGIPGTPGTDPTITITGSTASLNSAFTTGKIGAELNLLRVDNAGAASTDPSVAPLEKVRRQLDAFVDQFYSGNLGPPATPTPIQSAYDNATTNPGELASSLFIVSPQGDGGFQGVSGLPQPVGDDRNNFQVNPALLNGTSSLKIASANPVLQALTATSTVSAETAGDVSNFTGSITGFANAVAAAQSQRANTATTDSQQATATLSSIQTSYASSTGVSVDSQLSELIVLQNSYNASAKVISVANTMFQSLITAIS